MTSIDRMSKSFDILKIPIHIYEIEQRKNDINQLSRKDKIVNLNLIYDNLMANNVRQADEYLRMLSLSIEAFLVFFDDSDPDVYFVAEECLNKTIKNLLDTYLSRIQADLYRFVKKNGPERGVRGALIRFAEICHLVKLHKCRFVYFIKSNL
jgi:hypothetical protein